MVEIKWTDEAVKWLRDIYGYIAQDSTSVAANFNTLMTRNLVTYA